MFRISPQRKSAKSEKTKNTRPSNKGRQIHDQPPLITGPSTLVQKTKVCAESEDPEGCPAKKELETHKK